MKFFVLIKINKNKKAITKTKNYKTKLINSAGVMLSLLSSLVDNLAESLHKNVNMVTANVQIVSIYRI